MCLYIFNNNNKVQQSNILYVNLANVLNMLIVFFQILNIPQTYVNDKEIELHDVINNIIKSIL